MSTLNDEEFANTIMKTAHLIKKANHNKGVFQKVINDLKKELENPTYSLQSPLSPEERLKIIKESISKSEQGINKIDEYLTELKSKFSQFNMEMLYETAEVMVDFI